MDKDTNMINVKAFVQSTWQKQYEMEQTLQCLDSKVDNIIDFLSLNDVDEVQSAAGTMRQATR